MGGEKFRRVWCETYMCKKGMSSSNGIQRDFLELGEVPHPVIKGPFDDNQILEHKSRYDERMHFTCP